jgi:hypothetical protein
MNSETLKKKKYRLEYKLRILLQETEEGVYFDYLYELYNRLLEKGWLFPSEIKKIEQWGDYYNDRSW